LSYRDLLELVKPDGGFRLPQKLLLSATLSQDPEKISVFNLFQPKLFTTSDNSEDLRRYQERKISEGLRGQFIGKYTTPAELTELFCITEYKLKPLTLFGLIKDNNWKRFLCFTNTVEASHRLSFVLQTLFGKELVIEELSSFLPMKIRQKVLNKFSNGHVNGLICSDALARGIDIANIEVVISYDLPKQLKTYIHRIGRTARAGQLGKAVTIVAPDQIKNFENLLQTSNKTSVTELKPNRELEELNALNYANVLKKLQKALEIEEKEKKKLHVRSSGTSLFEKLQSQVKEPDVAYDILPEAWKPENLQAEEKPAEKKTKKKKTKSAEQEKSN
jgi:ATP-dependent RNA helicase DDX51/DBP6